MGNNLEPAPSVIQRDPSYRAPGLRHAGGLEAGGKDHYPAATGLPDGVLVSLEALSPGLSLFISGLKSRADQGLVFGQGSLSPEGSQLVYNPENYIRDKRSIGRRLE